MKRVFVALIASLIAASCAAVRTNVSVVHMLPAADLKTIAIAAYNENLTGTPEFEAFAAKVAVHLEAAGYDVVVASGTMRPDYVAYFAYDVDAGTPVRRTYSISQITDSVNDYPTRGTLNAELMGSQVGPATERVYRRTVTLDIYDEKRLQSNDAATFDSARVYRAWLMSQGSCPLMGDVIDPMLSALFERFPGESGRFRIVDLPTDARCGLKALALADSP